MNLLTNFLIDPSTVSSFSNKDWELLIRQAGSAKLLSRVTGMLTEQQLFDKVPERAKNHFNSARLKSTQQHEQVFFELAELNEQLEQLNVQAIVLKGAAYIATNKSAALGRTSSDIDILVRKDDLAKVEFQLCNASWSPTEITDYDDLYYRKWGHEIPPLIHMSRKTVLDVHHNILPLTSKDPIDASLLLDQKVNIAQFSHCNVLSPVDMYLHSATHLFHEGELSSGLRDLVDLKLLAQEFYQQDALFYQNVIARAKQLKLTRSLYLAIRYCVKVLSMPLPEGVWQDIETLAPSKFTLAWLDFIYLNTLVPHHSTTRPKLFSIANFALYIRGHLLRMPLYLLLPHLVRKSVFRFKNHFKDEPEDQSL